MAIARVEWINLSVAQPYDGGGTNIVSDVVGSAVALEAGATATAAESRPAAPAGARYARVTALGGAVIIAFGADPTAAADSGLVVPDGATELVPVEAGDLISVRGFA